MWSDTRLTQGLGLLYPIIQAPMAGGATTPELVAAVSNSGGLGSLAAGYLSPEHILITIKAIRNLTDRAFAVNLFVPEKTLEIAGKIEYSNRVMQTYRSELGIADPPMVTQFAPPFEEQMAVVLEANVPVFSFTFGILAAEWMQKLKAAGIVVMGTATTVQEALALERARVDFVVGQGSEAGGHRGTFQGTMEQSLIGTMALIPQMVDAVQVPVIAAGGIMDGRGVAAALTLGAEGVQMGTAFLTCPECGIHPMYKESILTSAEDATTLTCAFSGKMARGIKNRFIDEMRPYEEGLPDYPVQNALTRDIRQAAAQQNRTEFMSLWAGQGTRLSAPRPAGQLMEEVVSQVNAVLKKMR